jgi:ketosteroid isomerase-like protein
VTKPPAVTAAPVVLAKVQPTATVATLTTPVAAPAKTEPAKAAKMEPVKPAPAVVAKVEPPKPEPRPAAASSDADQQEILGAVTAWAKAWSARDVNGYLHFYGSDFQTPKGESRKAWSDERTARITGKGNISVDVQAPQVSLAGNTATVKFRQVYVSDRLKSDTRKTLVLTKQSGKWQIKQERTGN